MKTMSSTALSTIPYNFTFCNISEYLTLYTKTLALLSPLRIGGIQVTFARKSTECDNLQQVQKFQRSLSLLETNVIPDRKAAGKRNGENQAPTCLLHS